MRFKRQEDLGACRQGHKLYHEGFLCLDQKQQEAQNCRPDIQRLLCPLWHPQGDAKDEVFALMYPSSCVSSSTFPRTRSCWTRAQVCASFSWSPPRPGLESLWKLVFSDYTEIFKARNIDHMMTIIKGKVEKVDISMFNTTLHAVRSGWNPMPHLPRHDHPLCRGLQGPAVQRLLKPQVGEQV